MIAKDENVGSSFEDDLALTRRILAGSTKAWHEFLETYAELIFHVVRRHLPAADEDEVRGVYVDVLKSLYENGLKNYHGTKELRSWLILVSRRRTVDHLRALYGRNREPKGVGKLPDLDREVFQLYHVDRLPLAIVLHSLDWKGHRVSFDGLVESISRVEEAVGPSLLKKLDECHAARTNGNGMQKAVRYLVHLRVELEWRAAAEKPDERLMEKEAAKRVERIYESLSQLPEEDRMVAQMRFQKGLSADEIARTLELDKRREAYTLIERVRRRLRATLKDRC